MSANPLLHEWQAAEFRCITACRAIHARLRAGTPVFKEDLRRLAELSERASAANDRYRSALMAKIEANAGWMRAASQLLDRRSEEPAARGERSSASRDDHREDVHDDVRHSGNGGQGDGCGDCVNRVNRVNPVSLSDFKDLTDPADPTNCVNVVPQSLARRGLLPNDHR